VITDAMNVVNAVVRALVTVPVKLLPSAVIEAAVTGERLVRLWEPRPRRWTTWRMTAAVVAEVMAPERVPAAVMAWISAGRLGLFSGYTIASVASYSEDMIDDANVGQCAASAVATSCAAAASGAPVDGGVVVENVNTFVDGRALKEPTIRP
jgi:hypothetical protein